MANWIDIIFLIFILWTALSALWSGSIKALLDILAIFISVYIASFASSSIVGVSDTAGFIYLFAFLFIALYFILVFSLSLLQKLVKIVIFMPIDMALAAILGILKGVLIAGVLIILVGRITLPEQAASLVDASTAKKICAPALANSYKAIFGIIPKDGIYIKEDIGLKMFEGTTIESKSIIDEKTIKEVLPDIQKEIEKNFPVIPVPSKE